MRRRTLLAAPAALAMPGIARAATSTLRFVPHASLASLDALWSTALISYHHAFMVYDTLWGVDATLTPRLQMLEAAELSADRLTWTCRLREGLRFHDGEPVRSRDVVASLIRWSNRDMFGQYAAGKGMRVTAIDDRDFTIQLGAPFTALPYALGATAAFIIPERLANPDASKPVTEAIGSGPFRFLPKEWDAGAFVAYERNAAYVPRGERPDVYSGGKVAHFDRVEWRILPDPTVATNALVKGEVDWIERPHPDHLPTLRKTRGMVIEKLDPFGTMGMLHFNLKQPPFDNPLLRRAVLMAMDQTEYLQAVVGDDTSLWNAGVGWFTGGTLFDSREGIDSLVKGPRLDEARRLVKESGYDGRPVIHLAAGDIPANTAMSMMTAELYKRIGLNVAYTSIDWGVLVGRVAAVNDSAAPWASWNAGWTGLSTSNPGSHRPIAGNVPDPEMVRLRDAWFTAPDVAAQKQITVQMQRRAAEAPPCVPFGQYFLPHAHRNDLTGFTPAAVVAFWGVRRA